MFWLWNQGLETIPNNRSEVASGADVVKRLNCPLLVREEPPHCHRRKPDQGGSQVWVVLVLLYSKSGFKFPATLQLSQLSVFLFEVITKSVYSAPSEQKREGKIPHLHNFQPEMYSRQNRQGGRTAPLDKWFGSVFEGLWIPRPSVILTFKYTHRFPNIVPPFMTVVSGDRIYVSPMDTLGLLLNFMAISILIQSRFTGTIFFFVFRLFLITLVDSLHPFPFLKDKLPLCGPGCLWTHDPPTLALPGQVYGDKLVIRGRGQRQQQQMWQHKTSPGLRWQALPLSLDLPFLWYHRLHCRPLLLFF